MPSLEGQLDVQELHRDLQRKYRNVGKKVETIWTKFTKKQRETAMLESIGDGIALRYSSDRRLGDLYRFIPEYNLQDMTTAPGHFLSIFTFRASTSLHSQLYEGANGGPGDRAIMEKYERFAQRPSEDMTVFLEGEFYGMSFSLNKAAPMFPGLSSDRLALFCLPRAVGEMIIHRQGSLFQFLNDIVEEILELGSQTRAKKTPTVEAPKLALLTAVSKLSIKPPSLKSSFSEVLAQAMEAKAALDDYLLLLRSEPIVLNQAVNAAYWSRAELVPDDRGRILPAITDRYLSAAFFGSVTAAIKSIAIWDYVLQLLHLLDNTTDKLKRSLIIQELSNTYHLEYRRSQENFKRMLASPFHAAGKRFKRVTDSVTGVSKIVMKGQPADCTVSNPQLHYMLRLCHPDTTPVAAVEWIQKLDEFNAQHSEDEKKLTQAQVSALGDLVIIVSFIHVTSTAISMAPMSRKSGLLFTARATELEGEIGALKLKADFGDYVIPADNLLEPYMADHALAALDKFIFEGTGAKLGSLYEDIVRDSIHDLESIYTESKAKLENAQLKKADKTAVYVPLPTESSSSVETRLAVRRAKEKTRPTTSSLYTITAPLEPPQIVVHEAPSQIKVKASTVSLFETLFSKSEARGSVLWTAFESAMADIGFSVTPRGGSIFTFNPPASMETRPITLHRPHASEIESFRLLILARRLQRVYGWTTGTFIIT